MSLNADTLCVKYYGADWCGACKKVFPAVQTLVSRFDVALEEIDYDMLEEEEKSNITKLPTVLVLERSKNADIVHATFLTQHSDMLETWLRTHVRVNTSEDF
jgi:thiol-disulfide isomerase/thioredoxin